MEEKTKYSNPYLIGFLLGLLIVLTIYLNGNGVGASGAFKNVVVGTLNEIAPETSSQLQYIKEFNASHTESPWKGWLVFQVIGVVIGGFVSGLVSNRLKFKFEKGKNVKSKIRLITALIGGMLFGIGSQFGRGCTSGAGLDGMAVFSVAGFLVTMMIFGTGFAIAPLFKKLWL